MPRPLVWLLLLPVLSCRPAGGASPDADTQAQLIQARDAVWRAWFNNDTTLSGLLPPDFIGINWGEGPFEHREGALRGATQFVADGGKLLDLNFTDTEMQVYGEVAIVHSRYGVALTVGADTIRQSGRASEVFLRRGGRWINSSWHVDSGK